MTCFRCAHFTDRALSDAIIAPSKPHQAPLQGSVGICRRYPPALHPDRDHLTSRFPSVHRDHECGEFDAGGLQI